MAAGFVCGPWMSPRNANRLRFFTWVGLALCLAFVVLRAVNAYGDPDPWSVQKGPLFTLFSFLNCEKYPPSLLYSLMTLGPTFLFLALFERVDGVGVNQFATLGRVPLFFYLLHLPLIHGLAVLLSYLEYRRADWLFIMPPFSEKLYPPGYGYSLPVVYALYALVLAILWPACVWYAGLKQRKRAWWMSYL
jgi:hypothetical protein